MDPQSIVQALLKNSLCFYTLLFTHTQIEIVKQQDVLYVISDIVDATYNNVWQTHISLDKIDERIQEITNMYTQKNLPLIWWVNPSDTPADLSERLEKKGFMFCEQTSIMYRERSIPLLLSDEGLLVVRKVTTEKELLEFCDVKGGTELEINMHNELFVKFIKPHLYPIELVIGYHHEEAVCVAVLVKHDGIGSIHSFATKEEHQGKGYGSHMLTAVLDLLYATGCHVVLIDAWQDAVRFYQRQGFQEIGQYFKEYTA